MRTNARRGLTSRSAGFLLLAAVVSIALGWSARIATASTLSQPITVGYQATAVFDESSYALATAPLWSTHSALAESRPAETDPSTSAVAHLKRRIFVEDTTSPSSEALKAARIQATTESRRSPSPISPALGNSSYSVANRQRAP